MEPEEEPMLKSVQLSTIEGKEPWFLACVPLASERNVLSVVYPVNVKYEE